MAAPPSPPTGIQDWIYKLEEGEWKKYVKWLFVVLAFAGLGVLYDLREYKNFQAEEAMDAAQIALNVSEGKGFTTDYIRPVSVYLLHKRIAEKQAAAGTNLTSAGTNVMARAETNYLRAPHPDLANAPAYPTVLAGLMKVLPFRWDIPLQNPPRTYQPEYLITFFNQALFVTVIILVFVLARRLFDSGVAWLSSIVVAGTDLFWRFSVSGLSTMLLLVIVLVLAWCLVLVEQNAREEKRGTVWFAIIGVTVGLLMGMGVLTRYSFGWLIVPVVIFLAVYGGKHRVAVSVSAAIVFLLLLTPWLIRNHNLSGNLFGTAGFAIHQDVGANEPFPGNRLERTMSADLEAGLNRLELADYVRKLFANGGEIVGSELPLLGGSWLTAFFLVGLLVPFMSPTLSRLRGFTLVSLILLVIVQALGKTRLSSDHPIVNTENLLVLFAPLVFIFGTGMFFVLIDQVEWPDLMLRRFALTCFVLVMCAPLLFTFLPPRTFPFRHPVSRVQALYYPPNIQQTSRYMNSNELLMSDMPWAVAWYGDRKCIYATLDAPSDDATRGSARDFYEVAGMKPINALFLTPLTMDARLLSQIIEGKEFEWGKFVVEIVNRTNLPAGFPLNRMPRGYMPEQLFLTDRERWREPAKNR